MNRIEDLLNSLSKSTGVSGEEIYNIVVKNMYIDSKLLIQKNIVSSVVSETSILLNHFISEQIKFSAFSLDRLSQINAKIVEKNIELLKEFLQLALYAENDLEAMLLNPIHRDVEEKI